MSRAFPLLLLLGCACRDDGPAQLEQAQARYRALVDAQVAPSDPRWDEVTTLLGAIAPASSARPRADTLARALEAARARPPRIPLAFSGGAHLSPEVAAVLAECRALAARLGTTPEAARPRLLGQLDTCRIRAEQLDGHSAHPDGG